MALAPRGQHVQVGGLELFHGTEVPLGVGLLVRKDQDAAIGAGGMGMGVWNPYGTSFQKLGNMRSFFK